MTLVYGEAHAELFRKTALKTLSQPKNKKAIYDQNSRWNIYTDDQFVDFLTRTIDIYFPELELNFISRSDLRRFIDPIQAGIVRQAKICIENDSLLLFAPPDTLFSDGTVEALLEASKEKENPCVVVPHARALPSLLNEDYLLSNRELVDRTWEHLHKSWSDAQLGHERINFRAGGVIWSRHGKEITGTHMLPSPYLIKFTQGDVDFFERQISFGGFDHIWGSKMVIPQDRQVYLGDSDKAFIVEITDQFKNVPPIFPGDPQIFWREDTPNELTKEEVNANRQHQFTFRGAEK